MTYRSLFKKAVPVNVKEAQAKISSLIKSNIPSLVISHGKPVAFLIPYEEMLEFLDMLEELKDQRLLQQIAKARLEYKQGKKIPAENLFEKLGF